MKKFKKKICLVLAVILTACAFASCGSKKNSSSDGPVEIKWVMSGSEQTDAKMVWQKYNEELNKREGFENYKIDFMLIPFSDFGQKFMLMQTSGEKMDIVSTYNAGLGERAMDGTYLDLTDMMEEYAPDILKEIPQWAMKLCQVNGRQFAITNYQQMAEALASSLLKQSSMEVLAKAPEENSLVIKSDATSWIVLNVGHDQDINAAHVVSAIAEVSGLSGTNIGKIKIDQDETFVEIPKEVDKKIVKALKKQTIKGYPIEAVLLSEAPGFLRKYRKSDVTEKKTETESKKPIKNKTKKEKPKKTKPNYHKDKSKKKEIRKKAEPRSKRNKKR